MLKKRILCLLLAALTVALGACASPETPSGTTSETTAAVTESRSRADMVAGICLPDQQDPRWDAEGQTLQQELENLGYRVRLVYAEGDAQTQAQQILDLTREKVDCLVVAAVDSALLTQAVETAGEAGIHVIAYDRLLMDTAYVDYYVAFDHREMGRQLGRHIVAAKDLETAKPEESYTIEFFMGSPEDSGALELYRGIMLELQPYLETGTLMCLTGRTAFEDTCIVDWEETAARDNCADYLKEYYAQQTLDICCAASDSLAAGCISALEAAGYKSGEKWPLITGQGNTHPEHLSGGKQAFTVGKDTALLVERCAAMVDALLAGEEPQVNDTENCHNNVKAVPAYLCGFEILEG